MRPLLLLILCLATMLPFEVARGHGAYHELLEALTLELSKAPSDAGLLFERAKLHVSHEEWEVAILDLERVDRLKAGAIQTDGIRGQALNQGRLWAAALTVLNAHLRQTPNDLDALFERGRARFHLGDAGAADDYRTALATAESPEAGHVLEAVDAVRAKEGAQGASAFIELMIRTHGEEPLVMERAMHLAMECGRHEEALQHISSLQLKAPRPEPWMARRAQVLAEAGRAAEAAAAWKALHDHLLSLPNLERGTPLLSQLLADSQKALGIATPMPVVAAPLSSPSPSITTPQSSQHSP